MKPLEMVWQASRTKKNKVQKLKHPSKQLVKLIPVIRILNLSVGFFYK